MNNSSYRETKIQQNTANIPIPSLYSVSALPHCQDICPIRKIGGKDFRFEDSFEKLK
jgi:hypothetical protein